MAINMMCMNSKCKHYWEDNCMRNIEEERIEIDETGKCETFEEGISVLYTTTTHELKILPEYFTEVLSRSKSFELRKNDRNYKVGDVLYLREFDGEKYTGKAAHRFITYIFEGGSYGLDDNYVILSIK